MVRLTAASGHGVGFRFGDMRPTSVRGVIERK
jgi:hypothetical protein